MVTGSVDAPMGDGPVRERLRFFEARPLVDVRAERSSAVDIRLNADKVSAANLDKLEALLRGYERGRCVTRLRLEIPQRSETVLELGDDYCVPPLDDLLNRIEQIFGEPVAFMR